MSEAVASSLEAVNVEPFVRLALACIHREYPHHMVHLVASGADVRAPRDLNPAFYGCFDWHSAVHSHWSLVRAIHLFPDAAWAQDIVSGLQRNLTQQNLLREAEYFRAPGREGFERPYGLAWLLQLVAELRELECLQAQQWLAWLGPLEEIAVERLSTWLPRLPRPIRSGEHSQTAFAMGLAVDYAQAAGDSEFEQVLAGRAMDFYANDRDAPVASEPSGHDFLSPSLAEADLIRRIMGRDEFSNWLSDFLPGGAGCFMPIQSTDPADGKLSHLDGLNLSRAWMLDGIASVLHPTDPRRHDLQNAAQAHRDAGLGAIVAQHYSGAHWLGSFAMYLLTLRGIEGQSLRSS